jgi:hypothetical protein
MSVLQESLAAFRDHTNAVPRSPHDGEQTLQRILGSKKQQGKRVAFSVALCLSLAGSAVAVVATQRRAAHPGLGVVAAPAAPTLSAPAVSPVTSEARRPAPVPVPAVEPPLRVAPRNPDDAPARSPFRAEDDLFAKAQAEHAAQPGSVSELAAWTKYLGQYPEGRFSPEARYRRGVALAQLRRWDEARIALSPFAEGAAGDYRQEEAAEWLRSFPEP